MKKLRLAVLLGGCCAIACAPPRDTLPGHVSVQVSWAGTAPVFSSPPYFYARIDRGSADPSQPGALELAFAGPVELGSGGGFTFPQVLNGDGLLVVVELHQSQSPTSAVLYDGVSAPFSLSAGQDETVSVVLQAVPSAPDAAMTSLMTYERNPWGSSATGGAPTFEVVGDEGAVPAGATVVVYDGPDPLTADALARTSAAVDGAFTVTLPPVDRPSVYVGTLDAAGNAPSAAALVSHVSWTATFGGKTSGDLIGNPHVLETTEAFDVSQHTPFWLGPLSPDPAHSEEADDYTGAALPDAGSVTAIGARIWQSRPYLESPDAVESPALVYDAARGVSILFGGVNPSNLPENVTWSWDGATNSWTNVSPAGESPPARSNHGMAYDAANATILLFGGADANLNPLGDTWSWNGSVWSHLSPPGPTLSARSQISLAYDPLRGVVVLFGGLDASGETLNDTWEWNGSAWAEVMPSGPSPSARSGSAMSFDPAGGGVLLFGGANTAFTALSDTWRWNGTAWTPLTPAGAKPPAAFEPGMAADLGRRVVVMFGGALNDGNDGAKTWEWNGAAWTNMTPVGVNPAARSGAGMAYDMKQGVTDIFGGGIATQFPGVPVFNEPGGDIAAWSGQAWTGLTPTGVGPSARESAAAAFDSDGDYVVLFAGAYQFDFNDGQPVANDDDMFALTSGWVPIDLSTLPPARQGHDMAYDSDRNAVVLFGGLDSSSKLLSDTWEWNGMAWTNATPTTAGPVARTRAMMVYDSLTMLTVLFGGLNAQNRLLSDLWTWDGTTWTEVGTDGAVARYGAGMAYDSARDVIVLFGGATGNFSENEGVGGDDGSLMIPVVDDTWEWSGNVWTQVTPVGAQPSARAYPAMLYDPARGVTVLFGGLGEAEQSLNDTWEWNGTTWTEVTASGTNPAARDSATMVYAPPLTVLSGGAAQQGGAVLGDTWALSSSASRPATLATFSFAAAQAKAPTLQQISVTAFAGGDGSTVVVPPPGEAIAGTTLAIWDAWTGAWRGIASNTSGATAPAAMTYTTASASEASRYLFDPYERQTINLALFPSTPLGNGTGAIDVAAGYVEITVDYIE